MAAAYTLFLNQGRLRPPHPWYAADGSAPVRLPAPRPVSSSQAAFITLDMLRAVVERGTARSLGRQFTEFTLAGKTGTAHDGWFVGLCGNLIGCVWVGYDRNRDFPLSGGASALQVFAEFLASARQVFPVEPLSDAPPSRLVRRRICLRSGELGTASCPATDEMYFFKGTEPHRSCQIHH
jgi:penicillin-binding protein 1B